MPSPFEMARPQPKQPKQAPKPGSLRYDLRETKKDIKTLKAGGQAEVSLDEAKQAKRRIKEQIKAEVLEEQKAMIRQLNPRQLAEPRERQKMTTA